MIGIKGKTTSHRLKISEIERYLQMPKNDRICLNCTLNEIEDDVHFLTNTMIETMYSRELLINSLILANLVITKLFMGVSTLWANL